MNTISTFRTLPQSHCRRPSVTSC